MRKFVVVCLSAYAFITPAAYPFGEEETTKAATAEWITVQVQSEEGENVEVQLPLSLQDLISKVVDFDRLSELTEGKAKAPLAVMTNILSELRAAPPQEILTVESDEATVKIATEAHKRTEDAKPAKALKISVKPRQGKGDKVNITLPLGIFQMVAECIKAAPITEADFEGMGAGPGETGVHLAVLVDELPKVVASIREIGPINLVTVKSDKEEVRVWTE